MGSFDVVNTINFLLPAVWAYLIIINITSFIVYGTDKKKAEKGSWRTSEATLITLAVIGGSIGAILGIKIFHHKTRKPKFYIGVPTILILQIIALIAGAYIISQNII